MTFQATTFAGEPTRYTGERRFWNNGWRRHCLKLGRENANRYNATHKNHIPAYKIVRQGERATVCIPMRSHRRTKSGRVSKAIEWWPMWGAGVWGVGVDA